jgi:DNA-directed RNA polymerase specialized sigma24 family protein
VGTTTDGGHVDEQGFTEWASGRQRQLLRSAYLLTGDLHRAEDLVQEALTKVALRWSRLAEGNPTAYALRIIARSIAVAPALVTPPPG